MKVVYKIVTTAMFAAPVLTGCSNSLYPAIVDAKSDNKMVVRDMAAPHTERVVVFSNFANGEEYYKRANVKDTLRFEAKPATLVFDNYIRDNYISSPKSRIHSINGKTLTELREQEKQQQDLQLRDSLARAVRGRSR